MLRPTVVREDKHVFSLARYAFTFILLLQPTAIRHRLPVYVSVKGIIYTPRAR